MTENKRFKLDDFDSDVEMWELLNTQAEIISDLEKENKELKNKINTYKSANKLQQETIRRLQKQNGGHK